MLLAGWVWKRMMNKPSSNRMSELRRATTNTSFRARRLKCYPIGLFVKVRMISGIEIEAQISKIETTALGTFLHVEFDQQVANVTGQQILGFYDFCFVKKRMVRSYVPSARGGDISHEE
jgi:hypothetical protein